MDAHGPPAAGPRSTCQQQQGALRGKASCGGGRPAPTGPRSGRVPKASGRGWRARGWPLASQSSKTGSWPPAHSVRSVPIWIFPFALLKQEFLDLLLYPGPLPPALGLCQDVGRKGLQEGHVLHVHPAAVAQLLNEAGSGLLPLGRGLWAPATGTRQLSPPGAARPPRGPWGRGGFLGEMLQGLGSECSGAVCTVDVQSTHAEKAPSGHGASGTPVPGSLYQLLTGPGTTAGERGRRGQSGGCGLARGGGWMPLRKGRGSPCSCWVRALPQGPVP